MSFSCNPSLSSSQYHFIDIAFLLKNICNQSCISIETVTASSVPAPCTKQTLEARSKSLLNGKPKGKVGQNHDLLTEVYIPALNPTNACIRSKRRVFKGSWPWRACRNVTETSNALREYGQNFLPSNRFQQRRKICCKERLPKTSRIKQHLKMCWLHYLILKKHPCTTALLFLQRLLEMWHLLLVYIFYHL